MFHQKLTFDSFLLRQQWQEENGIEAKFKANFCSVFYDKL